MVVLFSTNKKSKSLFKAFSKPLSVPSYGNIFCFPTHNLLAACFGSFSSLMVSQLIAERGVTIPTQKFVPQFGNTTNVQNS